MTFAKQLPIASKGRWYQSNRSYLLQWLQHHSSEKATSRNASGSAEHCLQSAAVFDWDNTCIFNDIAHAIFRWQLQHLCIKLSYEDLRTLLSSISDKVGAFVCGTKVNDLVATILQAYAALLKEQEKPLSHDFDIFYQPKSTAAHDDFKALMAYYYQALEQLKERQIFDAYLWLPALLQGLSEQKLLAITLAAWQQGLQEAIGFISLQHRSPILGTLKSQLATGLRLHEEIIQLWQSLQIIGMPIYIVTASPKIVVQSLCQHQQLPIKQQHILGMPLQTIAIAEHPHPKQQPLLTFREGKSLALQQQGIQPLFVAGDADTDYAMLSDFSETELRLIINRNNQGQLKQFYQLALRENQAINKVDHLLQQRTLLQGRDENTGQFIESPYSCLYGQQQLLFF